MGHFALSVVGRDRPGIVAEVSRVLFELGCNIEDSTCTILSGQFAMILVIAHAKFSSAAEIDPFFDPVRKNMGLTISLHTLKDEEIFKITKEGGPAVKKSQLMPAWGAALSDQDIRNITAHIRTFAK